MESIKISVIMPIYNVDAYIRQGLDTVVGQSLKEIEIICVDDGSTDNSYSILEEYAQKDHRITLIQQKNQGAGVARNTGLTLATGKYLLFLDPDDFFELTMLEELYERAEKTAAEVVICHAKGFNDKDQCEYEIHRYYNEKNVPKKDIFSYFDMKETIFSTFGFAPWNKLVLRSFVEREKIRFQEIFRANDAFFVASILIQGKKIAVLDKTLLFYRTNMVTEGKKKINSYPLSVYQAFFAIAQMLQTKRVSVETKEAFLVTAMKFIFISYDSVENFQSKKEIYQKIQEDMEKDFHISTVAPEKFVTSQYRQVQKIQKTPFDQYLYENAEAERREISPLYLSLVREKYKNLCLFGAGLQCQKMLQFFSKHSIPFPVGICDNSPALQGTSLEGILVYSFEDMVEKYPDLSLIITLKNDYSDVEHQVLQKLDQKQIVRLFI